MENGDRCQYSLFSVRVETKDERARLVRTCLVDQGYELGFSRDGQFMHVILGQLSGMAMNTMAKVQVPSALFVMKGVMDPVPVIVLNEHGGEDGLYSYGAVICSHDGERLSGYSRHYFASNSSCMEKYFHFSCVGGGVEVVYRREEGRIIIRNFVLELIDKQVVIKASVIFNGNLDIFGQSDLGGIFGDAVLAAMKKSDCIDHSFAHFAR